MKLKKKTGMMLVAASAAAVVGVAAVSFAAWTNTTDSVTAVAETGTVSAFGFGTAESFTLAGTRDAENKTALIPYDQNEATIATGNYIVSANLPAYSVYAENYSISVTVATANADQKLYVKLSDNTALEAVSQTAKVETLEADGWKEITTEKTGAQWIEANTAATEISTKYINVILVSSKVPDATVSFDLTVTLDSIQASNNG